MIKPNKRDADFASKSAAATRKISAMECANVVIDSTPIAVEFGEFKCTEYGRELDMWMTMRHWPRIGETVTVSDVAGRFSCRWFASHITYPPLENNLDLACLARFIMLDPPQSWREYKLPCDK